VVTLQELTSYCSDHSSESKLEEAPSLAKRWFSAFLQIGMPSAGQGETASDPAED